MRADNSALAGPARRTLLVCAALLLVGTDALAAQRFISSTRLTTDDTGATLSVEFNCKVTYLRHAPEARGDRLTIELDPTTICNGVSPLFPPNAPTEATEVTSGFFFCKNILSDPPNCGAATSASCAVPQGE